MTQESILWQKMNFVCCTDLHQIHEHTIIKFQSTHDVNSRWMVLPQLRAGGVYSINIYATVNGRLIKIYTVTVKRKFLSTEGARHSVILILILLQARSPLPPHHPRSNGTTCSAIQSISPGHGHSRLLLDTLLPTDSVIFVVLSGT